MKNTRTIRSISAVIAMLACSLVAAQSDDSHFVEQVAGLLANAEAEGASGVVRVTRGGDVVFESGYGSASCDEDMPVGVDHVFLIGSITKEFTQLLAHVLEERGVLSRTDTLGDWLPGFEGAIGTPTLQQVMNHVGGLPDLIDENGEPVAYTVDYDYMPVSRDELITKASRTSLIHEPGTTEEYSNLGYQLLAAIFELATGETYPDLVEQYIFEPAGMTETSYWFDDKSADVLVDGCYSGGERWGNPVEDRMWGETGPSWNLKGAGGHLSTAESLGKFFDGIGDSVYFETEEQAERYRSGRLVFSERREQLIMGPGGSNGIFDAAVLWLDGDRVALVMMSNRADHMVENGLIQDIARLTR